MKGPLVALLALMVIDYRQTIQIFRRGFRELNPVIRWAHRSCGERGILVYYLVCAAMAVGLWSLPLSENLVTVRFGITAAIVAAQALICLSNRRLLRG